MATSRTSHDRLDISRLDEETRQRFGLDRLPLDRPTRTMTELLRLDGKVALVTGAGGDGSGNAICHRLAEQGANIAVLDVNKDVGEHAAQDIARRWGVETVAVTANVADRQQVAEVVAAVVADLGTIDVLVNNAGGSGAIGLSGEGIGWGGPFVQNSADYIDTVVAVNLLGLLNVTQEVLKVMLTAGAGRIVNISSEGGKTWMENLAVYNASKSAVLGFTRNLAIETGPQGVSVVAVNPGIMLTQRHLDAPIWEAGGPVHRQYGRVSVGRPSVVDDVACMVAFLSSEAGAYVHGTSVSVGGGISD
jgi:NAD(P)-dependent dehydrogenase (short-subunit alcohol dehydrogenase family)